MKVDQLRSFIAIAQEGNFTKAAARLHLAQPALTRQIAKLESAAGVRLFERTTRSVELTEQGRILLPAAIDALDRLDSALQEARSLDAEQQHILVVGFVYRYLSHPVSDWLDDYRSQHPELAIKVVEKPFSALLNLIQEGTVDVGVMGTTDLAVIPPQLSRHYFREVHEEILLWKDHPLAQKEYLTSNDIEGERLVYPYINPEPHFSPLHRDILEQELDVEFVQSGFDMNAFEAVEQKQGIMGLPSSRRHTAYNLACVPYASHYTIKSFILWHEAGRKPCRSDFVAYLKHRADELAKE